MQVRVRYIHYYRQYGTRILFIRGLKAAPSCLVYRERIGSPATRQLLAKVVNFSHANMTGNVVTFEDGWSWASKKKNGGC